LLYWALAELARYMQLTSPATRATTLWSVVDPNQEFATRLATQYQARQQSLDEAMTDPNVHAVLIASATDTHADLIEMAARHGKAIFCEKPVHLDRARLPESGQRVRRAAVHRL
jgi:predicted dehydrogenase